MQPYLAEFVGTALLLLLGNGVVANVLLQRTKGHNGGWIVITFGWGMAVFVAVFCVSDISGAHINPAVTVGLVAAGRMEWTTAVGYVVAQMLGAMFGALLVWIFYRDHYEITEDPEAIRATFCTGPAIRNPASNFVSEVIGTFVLVFAVLMAREPSLTFAAAGSAVSDVPQAELGLGALGALPVGLLVFAIGLSLGGTTGYAINPARDLGPRVMHAVLPISTKGHSDWSYAWVPVAGPIAGALLAATAAAVFAR